MASISGDFSTNLRAYYKCDDVGGDIDNVEGTSAYDLTANNSPTYGATGIIEDAIELDVSGIEYLSNTASGMGFTNTDEITVSFWFNFKTALNNTNAATYMWAYQFSSSVGYINVRPRINGGNEEFLIQASSNSITFQEDPSTNTWHHLVITKATGSTGTVNVYYDGVNKGNASFVASGGGNNRFYFGNWFSNSQTDDWRIDEIGVWEDELSSTDVATLYNSGDGIPYEAAASTFIPRIMMS